jgi:hypothetical protein
MAPRLIRRFTEMLGLLDRGKFESKLNTALNEAIDSLETQPAEKGKATLTLTLNLAYQGGMLQVLPEIKSKLPEADKSGPTMFWTHEGALSTQHPQQIDLEETIRDATPKASAATAAG